MNISTSTSSLPSSHRKVSLTAGLLYLLTFVSIPTLALYGAIHDPSYITGQGPDTPVLIGAILEIIVALAGIGTAVVLYSVLKKQNESLALGLVGARVLEASAIFAGVASLLTIVGLRQAGIAAEMEIIGHVLVTLYDRIFLISQSFLPAVNDLLLGILLFQSRLVPRKLAMIGIFGAFVLVAGDIAILFGLVGRQDSIAIFSALPVALFEFLLGIWLVIKGFNPQAVAVLGSKVSE